MRRIAAWAPPALLLLAVIGGCAVRVPPAPRITMTPSPGIFTTQPGGRIVVRAEGGRLSSVVAFAGRDLVPGGFDPSHTVWRSARPLRPVTEYAVIAVAAGAQGVTSRLAHHFRTITPYRTGQG
ncbi:Ig-like domain-containing protein [Sphaerimonospora sp. CA-214678]|uniref:Ig-like domain-containing protein n=1 Tax=Sphaerimonospora sp. CA-214678 TaxID=3240029 RepID=UPI003D8BA0AB